MADMNDGSGKNKIFKTVVSAALLIIAAAVVVILIRKIRANDFSRLLTGERTVPADEFYYDMRGESVYADVGGGFAVVSELGVQMLDEAGHETFMSSFRLDAPAVTACATRAAAYDIGGTRLRVFDAAGVTNTLDQENTVISAKITEKYLAVCTAWKGGYTSAVTVYNTNGSVVFRWYCSSGYVFDASVSDGDETVSILTVTDSGCELLTFSLRSTASSEL